MLDLVVERLLRQISKGDPLSSEFAIWLGVHQGDHQPCGPANGLWNPRDVAIAGVRDATGRPTPRPFTAGLAALRGRKFFVPHHPGVFETDPLAMLCVAIGVRHIADDDSAAWLAGLAERAMQGESDAWRISLLGATSTILFKEAIRPVSPDLTVALSTKGIGKYDQNTAEKAMVVCLALDDPPADQAAVRLSALRAICRMGEATRWNASAGNSESREALRLPVPMVEPSKVKILFLGANPSSTTQLALGREVREITQRLYASPQAERFEFVQEWAVRIRDLQAVLLRHRPQIVHFSGHGRDERTSSTANADFTRDLLPAHEPDEDHMAGEILVEDDAGRPEPIPASALADLFRILGGVRCVVLNACHSAAQAEAIHQHVDTVVGMSRSIGDVAAVNFAFAFYQGLAFGESVSKAFDLGRNQIDLAGLGDGAVPKLLTRHTPGDIRVFLSRSR